MDEVINIETADVTMTFIQDKVMDLHMTSLIKQKIAGMIVYFAINYWSNKSIPLQQN